MKIGIGVITTQNRKLHPNLANLIDGPTNIYIHVDEERRGPAYGRNKCIKALYDSGCDFIALFDDDVYPIKKGWQSTIAAMMVDSGVDVIGYPDPSVATKAGSDGQFDFWTYCTGCFTMVSRKAVETIGYYDNRYRTYGHEDIGYLARARFAGLTGPYSADASPARVAEFIHSEDIYGSDRDFDPYANMSAEEKQESIEKNRHVFDAEVGGGPLFIPYCD